MNPVQPGAQRVICDRCGARAWLNPGEELHACPDCGGPFRSMGLLEGIVDRWFAPPAQHVSEYYPRHLKLIELMWTGGGRGRETYDALNLKKVSYAQFVTRATQVVVKGLQEGWIVARIPLSPTMDDEQYEMHFLDPGRWADELVTAFATQLGGTDAAPSGVDVVDDTDAA